MPSVEPLFWCAVIEMNYLFSQRLLVRVVVTAAIISQTINAKKVNVTTKANKCKDRDAVKEVNITFTPSNTSDCKYSFGCGKHEPDYPPCPTSQQKPQSVMSAEHRNDTCAFSSGGSGRLARSANDGRCYRICDSCDGELVNGSETLRDAEGAKSHTADKSQSRQTCIEEKHTAEYIIEHSKKDVANEGCKWKYKCQKKKNNTNYAEKAVGIRLRPSKWSRIRIQLYCCEMNCSYNCTKHKFDSAENQTIMSKLNESEVLTEIQVQKYGKKDGIQMYAVILNTCSECPPGLPAHKDPPVIPVPVLAIGYGDDPDPRKYNECGSCREDEDCSLYCRPKCSTNADCTERTPKCDDGGVCVCTNYMFKCGRSEECCSDKCVAGECAARDSSCIYDIECSQFIDQNGNTLFIGVCSGGQCQPMP